MGGRSQQTSCSLSEVIKHEPISEKGLPACPSAPVTALTGMWSMKRHFPFCLDMFCCLLPRGAGDGMGSSCLAVCLSRLGAFLTHTATAGSVQKLLGWVPGHSQAFWSCGLLACLRICGTFLAPFQTHPPFSCTEQLGTSYLTMQTVVWAVLLGMILFVHCCPKVLRASNALRSL